MKIKNFLKKLIEPEPEATHKENADLADILKKYSIVEAVPGNDAYPAFLVVTDKNHRASELDSGTGLSFIDPNFSGLPVGPALSTPLTSAYVDETVKQFREKAVKGEIGSSSPSPYTAELMREYNRELQGLNGLEKFQKMRFSDGVIAGQLLLIKTPVNAGRWFIKSANDKKASKNMAKFTWDCLTEYQSITWTQIKQEAMLSCDFGYSMLEKVWENRVIDGKTRTVLAKLAPRSPLDVKKWIYDEHGGPKSVIMYVKVGNDDYSYSVEEREIPIKKLIIFTYNKEFNNLHGRSVLRPMYKHHYYKDQLYKIDAIQKERHGIGIPVIRLPTNYSQDDKVAAETLGRNLRTNERAHVVLPYGWELEFAELRGQPVDALKSIELHDRAIRESILAGFIDANSVTKEEDLGLFLKATRFLADSICDAFNTYLIPELINYNFDNVKEMPKLTVRQIGEQGDLRTMSFALRNMIGAKVIQPDDVLEAHIREVFDLPMADKATIREIKTPQAGGDPNGQSGKPGQSDPNAGKAQSGTGKENQQANKPGMPRQTPLPPVGVGGKRAGIDKGQS